MDEKFTNLPFQLTLTSGEQGRNTVVCEEKLRFLPGKRLTCAGKFKGDDVPVVVKLFPPSFTGKRHYRREHAKLQELRRRDIPVPEVLAQGESEAGGCYALVLEKIGDGKSVKDELDATSELAEKRLINEELICLLARKHRSGVCQKDLHAANYIRDERAVWTIDAGMVSFAARRRELGKKKSIAQLARLLLPYEDGPHDFLEWAFFCYCHYRGIEGTHRDFRRMQKYMFRQKLYSLNRLLKKYQRSNSRHVSVKDGGCQFVVDREFMPSESFRALLFRLDEELEAGEIIKRGNSSFISKLVIDGKPIIVKRYNYKGIVHSLRHTVKGSRAKRSWLNGHRLTALHISTPRPLAFVERRKFGIVVTSYIFTPAIDGTSLRTYLMRADAKKQREMAEIISGILQKMQKYKIVHGDLKENNLLVHDDGCLSLVDLDGMKTSMSSWFHLLHSGYRRDRERFLRNWRDLPELENMFKESV